MQNELRCISYSVRILRMPSKPSKHPRTQNRATNVSLYPLSPDDAVRAILSIGKDDVKRIVAKKPAKRK